MKEIKLTGDALLQAMEGIPDEILERSEERGAGVQRGPETEDRKAGSHIINGPGNKKKKARWTVTAGRLAMAAAALLLVLAGRNLLFRGMGSGMQNAEPAMESTMGSTADYAVETEEAAGNTVTAAPAAGDAKGADVFDEAAEAEESTAVYDEAPEEREEAQKESTGEQVSSKEETLEDFVQKTAEEITEACRSILRTIEETGH